MGRSVRGASYNPAYASSAANSQQSASPYAGAPSAADTYHKRRDRNAAGLKLENIREIMKAHGISFDAAATALANAKV
jgi:hypothetical protein